MIILRVAILVLALLWAQAAGLWHGVVHPFAGHAGQAQQTQSQPAQTPTTQKAFFKQSATAVPLIFGLLSAHDEGVDCQLFDQLGHGDALTPLLTMAQALVPAPARLRASHAHFVLRWHQQFQARGPPSVR